MRLLTLALLMLSGSGELSGPGDWAERQCSNKCSPSKYYWTKDGGTSFTCWCKDE